MKPVTVYARSEDLPGPKWAAEVRQRWPAYRAWFLRDGIGKRPTYLAGERALRRHMPELLPLYSQLIDAAGGGDLMARFLACWCPPPYATGCSQGVWLQGGAPLLVRTYDYHPALWERSIWRTGWLGRPVVGNSDCLWGLLDGINDAGLCVSLAFGGRRVVGDGFGIPLILRYALQVCESTAEAVEVLSRVPCSMAYTVTVLDAEGRYSTVFLSPDRPAVVSRAMATTNHQAGVEWPEHALSTESVARLAVVADAAVDPGTTAEGFVGRFLRAPVWSNRHAKGAGTLYAACYTPARRTLTMLWPKSRWEQGIEAFDEGARQVSMER